MIKKIFNVIGVFIITPLKRFVITILAAMSFFVLFGILFTIYDNVIIKDYANNTNDGIKISKGDCRIVNPRLAYDNDYDLYIYRFEEGNIHAFSVDNMGVIRDISNISKDGKADNYEGKIFEEFNKNNKNFKVLTHVKYSNREIFYVKKDDNGFDATSELYKFYLGVQYLYFKYLRNTDN